MKNLELSAANRTIKHKSKGVKITSKEPIIGILIPARSGSISIQDKNRQKVHHTPLFQRAINHAKYCVSDKAKIIVSTNDEVIISQILEKDSRINDFLQEDEIFDSRGILIHRRLNGMATSTSSTWELIPHINEKLNLAFGYTVQRWAIFQPTTPFRSKEELEFIFEYLKGPKIDSQPLISVREVGEVHPSRMYKLTNEDDLIPYDQELINLAFEPRQNLSKLFIRDGGYYLFENSHLNLGRRIFDKSNILSRKFPWSINIDERQDLIIAQSIPESLYRGDPNDD